MGETVLKTELLDKGSVELIDKMPALTSAEMAVVNAARVSYLGESKGEMKDRKLLEYMLRHKHTSPFEQVVFKFKINAPLLTHWQLVRHRTFSFNYQSGRYTEFEEDSFYIPETWRKQAQNGNKQMSDGQLSLAENNYWNAQMEYMIERGYSLYQEAIKNGIAREQARLFLPAFGVYYACVFTVDAHNLMHFLRLRLAPEAQYEIRVYARAMYNIYKSIMPWTCEFLEKEEGAPWLED